MLGTIVLSKEESLDILYDFPEKWLIKCNDAWLAIKLN